MFTFLGGPFMHQIKTTNKKTNTSYSADVYWYVEEKFASPLNLDEVAQHFHLNKCYFCSVLKKETGKTFSQIVNEIRIEKSKVLLKYSSLSILSIALAVGFNNQNYFNITFKKLMGMTPLNYRKLVQSDQKKA